MVGLRMLDTREPSQLSRMDRQGMFNAGTAASADPNFLGCETGAKSRSAEDLRSSHCEKGMRLRHLPYSMRERPRHSVLKTNCHVDTAGNILQQ